MGGRESWKSADYVGLGMMGGLGDGWLSTEDLLMRLAEAEASDVTETRLARWRTRKLLDNVEQRPRPFPQGGSTTFHPPGTFERVLAIRALQAEMDDLGWIGRQLWWRYGFPVAEELWRPLLQETATKCDPALTRIRSLIRQSESADELAEKPAEQLAAKWKPNILTSRIIGRVPANELPQLLTIILYTAAGNQHEYSYRIHDDDVDDEELLSRALDLRRSNIDSLAGQKFGFADAISSVLADIAAAIASGTLAEAANADRTELEAARDDFRRAGQIASGLYQSTKWIYGDGAFGLRFADWCARKAPPEVVRLMLLFWVLMRRSGAELLDPEEITELHRVTMATCNAFEGLRRLHMISARHAKILSPQRLKRILNLEEPLPHLLIDLESLRNINVDAVDADSPADIERVG